MDNVKALTREKFLAIVTKRKIEPVTLPGGTIYLKEPDTNTILAYRQRFKGQGEIGEEEAIEASCELIAEMACDEQGNKLLTKEDVAEIRKASMETYKVLSTKALGFAGAKEVSPEEATNNLKNDKS